MNIRTALALAVVLIVAAGGCNRRVIRIPETQFQVVSEIDSKPVAGVEVSVNLRVRGGEKEQLFSGTTDESGSLTMPGTTVQRMRGYEVLFGWKTPGATAEMMLMAPPTRFPGKDKLHRPVRVIHQTR